MRKLIIGLAALTAVLAPWGMGYRVNWTPSYPSGIYRLDRGAEARKGMLVLFCPPDGPVFREAKLRGYLSSGRCPGHYAPLLKRLVATAGDRVKVAEDGVWVNGVALPKSRPLGRDLAGRPMPMAAGGTMPTGWVWLMSEYAAGSFDSRYFGAIEASRIQGTVKPVWTWE